MTAAAAKVRALDDALRTTFQGGRVLVTSGVRALPPEEGAAALEAVRGFAAFAADDDPHGEHDFGSFELGGRRILWKIDCYDPELTGGSEDPADPAKTVRVLTIMLAEEYWLILRAPALRQRALFFARTEKGEGRAFRRCSPRDCTSATTWGTRSR